MPKFLNVKDKRMADAIADMAIRFSREAAQYLPADECDLRLQIAAGLLKATMLPTLREKFIASEPNNLVGKLFADGARAPDLDDEGFDLV
jgi:hypothetical protein